MRIRRQHHTLRRRPRSRGAGGVRAGHAALLQSAFRVTEHDVQAAVVTWASWRGATDVPALSRLFAVPNGGLRKKATAGKLKAEGVRPGMTDLVLPYPSRGYHGLYLETKLQTGVLAFEQRDWLEYLASAGYCAGAGWGVDAMQYALSWYVDIDVSPIAVPIEVRPVDGYFEWRPARAA